MKVVYPGTFDPVTFGHLDVARRALRLFPQVIFAVSESRAKNPTFTAEKRAALLRATLESSDFMANGKEGDAQNGAWEVRIFDGFLVDFCRAVGARLTIRGIRAVSDFENEFQMAWTNHRLDSEVETVFLFATESNHFVSSRMAKEVARLGGALDAFVPPLVAEALREKFSNN